MAHKSETNPLPQGDEPPILGPSLSGVSFPATRDELVELARRNQADDEIIEALQALPARRFADMTDLLSDYGYARVHGRSGVGTAWHPKR